MSTKNFVSNGDAETLFTGIGNKLSSLKSGFTNLDNEVNGDSTTYPYADVITIPDAIPANLADCTVKIEPVQDLHGQSAPYVGGAGKNKLGILLSSIISGNNHGTWNNNVYTYDNMVFTISTNNEGYIIGVQCVGSTGENAAILYFPNMAIAQESILNGCPSGGSSLTYGIQIHETGASWYLDTGNGATLPSGNYDTFSIIIRPNQSNVNLIFYPMLRLSTETDATFAPYTNICPISGHTEASVQRDGKNLCSGINDNYYINNTGTQAGKTVDNSGLIIDVSNFEKVTISTSEVQTRYRVGMIDDVIEPNTTATLYNGVVKDGTSDNITISTNGRKYLVVNATRLDIIQVEIGEVATAYVPYVEPKTYTIALGDTVYGGTVDFDSGVCVSTKAMVDMGTLTWSKDAYDRFYSTGIASSVKAPASQQVLPDALCSNYPVVKMSEHTNKTLTIATNGTLYVNDYDYAEASDFKTAMSGVQLCYELATPTTIQLTPQQIQLLKGTNTLTASTGDISVTVNGVSGAIGSVQEQVNDIASDKQDKTDNALNTTAKTVVGGINELKSDLTNVTTEVNKSKTVSGGTAWPSDTLVFSISPDNGWFYRFIAVNTSLSGNSESGVICVRQDNTVLVLDKSGTFTTAFNSTNNKLTITLPNSAYWLYRMEKCASRLG